MLGDNDRPYCCSRIGESNWGCHHALEARSKRRGHRCLIVSSVSESWSLPASSQSATWKDWSECGRPKLASCLSIPVNNLTSAWSTAPLPPSLPKFVLWLSDSVTLVIIMLVGNREQKRGCCFSLASSEDTDAHANCRKESSNQVVLSHSPLAFKTITKVSLLIQLKHFGFRWNNCIP